MDSFTLDHPAPTLTVLKNGTGGLNVEQTLLKCLTLRWSAVKSLKCVNDFAKAELPTQQKT